MRADGEEARCVGCGCTDLCACKGGCSWLDVNRDDGTGVCSRCPKHLAQWRNQQADGHEAKRAIAADSQFDALEQQTGERLPREHLTHIGPTDI